MDVQSFNIDHDQLEPGLYVSRKDNVGSEVVTTFDIRMKAPNRETVMGTAEMHTLEHLMAIFIRSPQSGWADELLYIGPMGCRTGMYMLVKGDKESKDVLQLMKDTYAYIRDFNDKIPATISRECGNYLDHNLKFAQIEAEKYLKVLENIRPDQLVYPE